MTGSEALVLLLEELGVEVIFGLCGDTSLPFYEALSHSDKIRHVLTRDERSASFMADAYARLSGRVGVCEGPSGGGATYILPGIAEANDSSVPVVCLTTDISVSDRGKGTLTELDQQALFTPVTKRAFAPETARDMLQNVRSAFRAAASGSLGACHVALPFDVQAQEADTAQDLHATWCASYPQDRRVPEPDAVRDAARLLAESRRPLIIAGAGVIRSGAWNELKDLSQALGAAVATSIGGKGSIAETDPLSIGVVGGNGGLPWRHDLMRTADVIFHVGGGTGSVTTQKWTLPAPGDAIMLQLDTNAAAIGRNYDVAAGIRADAELGLAALTAELDRIGTGGTADRWDPNEIERRRTEHMETVADLFESDESPIRPERLMQELFAAMPQQSIVLADPGTPCPYVAAYWRLSEAGRWFVSPRAFGALGYALPAVVGAYCGTPDAGRIVAVMGDGSFGISVGELETLARLDLPVTLIVCNNSAYGWIKAGQKSRGSEYFSVDFGDTDNAAIARAFGLRASRIEDPRELGEAMRQALTHDGPFLLDVVTQPLEQANAPVSKWIA
jgi:acetolactate synthase-1/2/3 large subunit